MAKNRKHSSFIPVVPKMSQTGMKHLQNRYFYALYTRKVDEVMYCLEKGVDPNVRSPEYGISPLHMLAERNDVVLGFQLVSRPNVDLDLTTMHGFTALHLACIFNKKKFVILLLQNGANPNIPDRNRKRAIHYAIEHSNFAIFYQLIKYKADLNVIDCFENTPLSLSLVEVPNLVITHVLFKNGADLNLEQIRQLHVFFELILGFTNMTKMPFIEALLDQGVDINMIDKRTGRNCLHFVAITGNLDLAVFLAMKGADMDLVDKSFRTPAKIATDHRNLIVADYFRKGYRPPNLVKVLPTVKAWRAKVQARIAERRALSEEM